MSTGLNGLGENQVNVLATSGDGLTGTQADPAVTALGGSFIEVYENPQAGGSNIDLLAQGISFNGTPIGIGGGLPSGILPIDQTADVTIHPAIALTPDSSLVVVYTDVTQNTIVVRKIGAAVSAPFVVDAGNGPGHQPNTGPVDNAAIGTFADGTILVAWEFDFAHSATNHDVYFAFLNSNANGFTRVVAPLDVHNAFEGEARIATSGNTGAIVYAGDPGTIGGGQDIILTQWNSVATETAAPSNIFGTNSGDIYSHPDVAALSDGRFVIAAHDDTAGNVQVALYSPTTHAVTQLPGLTLAGASPHVAGLPDGGFVLSFDTTGGDIGVLRVGANGLTSLDTGLANSFTTGTQSENALAVDAIGNVFVTWQDAGAGNPHSTDTDTRIEGQAFSTAPLAPHWQASVATGQWTGTTDWVPGPIGDFNHDGTSDMFWNNPANGLTDGWLLGNGAWAASMHFNFHPVGTPSDHYLSIASGDFNNDGTSDLLWYNPTSGNPSSGDLDIWKIVNGNWAGSSDLGTHPAGWQPVATGDFNGDGTSDVLWYNPTSGDAEVWKLSNAQWSGSVDIGAHPLGYTPVATGDFDHDGTSDVLWFNPTTRDVDLWKISNGHWAGSVDIGTHPAGYTPVGVGDFNRDGTSDIVWFNAATGDTEVWLIANGHWSASVDFGSHPAGWTPVGIGDFDNNGVSDILWRETATNKFETWLLAYS